MFGTKIVDKTLQLILSTWILSHVGHAVLSVFYEESLNKVIVPLIYAVLTLAVVGAWRGNRRAGGICAALAAMTLLIQGIFIWNREAYGALSTPVLVFDVMGMVASLAYLLFLFSSRSALHFQRTRGT